MATGELDLGRCELFRLYVTDNLAHIEEVEKVNIETNKYKFLKDNKKLKDVEKLITNGELTMIETVFALLFCRIIKS